jgi:hypothetical protein
MSNGRKRQTKEEDLGYSIVVWSFYVGCACALGVAAIIGYDLIQKNRAAMAGTERTPKKRKVRRPSWLHVVSNTTPDQDVPMDSQSGETDAG